MASCRSWVALQIVSNARNRCGRLAFAVAVRHRLPEHLADLERLRTQHGCLVRAPDAVKMPIGIEVRRDGVLEPLEEGRAIAATPDVVACQRCFSPVEDDEKVTQP